MDDGDDILEEGNLIVEDLLLDDLFKYQLISETTFVLCEANGLDTLSKITEFYNNHNSFLFITDCSAITNHELIAVCEKLKTKNLHLFDSNFELDLINSLTPPQFEILGLFFDYNLLILKKDNPKLHLFLMYISGDEFSLEFTLNKIFSDDFDLRIRDWVRLVKITGYYKFKTVLENFIYSVSSNNESDLIKTSRPLLTYLAFQNLLNSSNNKVKFVYEVSGKIKLFASLNKFIIETKIFLQNIQFPIFQFYYTQKSIDYPTLQSIADKIHRSSERVRQVADKIHVRLRFKLELLYYLNSNVFIEYNEPETDLVLFLDEAVVDTINANEHVNFNKAFYIIIYNLLYSKKYQVFVNSNVHIPNTKFNLKKKIDSYILIQSDLYRCFNFETFISLFARKMNNLSVALFNLHENIATNLSSENESFRNDIYQVCRALLRVEFDVYPDVKGNIYFRENNWINPSKLCYDLMKTEGKPLHVNYMCEVFCKLYPWQYITTDIIRSALMANKNIFVFFGRTSIWGLKEWENKKANYKGGTIRSIAIEFLKDKINPVAPAKLVKYVLKYRPNSYSESILYNLKIDSKNRFIFFENQYVGLSQIQYPAKYYKTTYFETCWENRKVEIKKFLKTNQRFPSPNSKDKTEQSLGVYFRNQKNYFQYGILSKEKEAFLRSINYPLD